MVAVKPATKPAKSNVAAPVVSWRPRGSYAKALLAKLRKPEVKDIAELAEKMREDYQITLAELVIAANIRAVNYSVSVESPASASPRDQKRAELLGAQCQKLWQETLPRMVDAFGNGRVAFEKINAYEAVSGLNFFKSLEDLPFAQTEMALTDQGDFAGIELTVGEDGVTIPPDCSWWLALDATALEPHGRSRFLGAPHKTWERRQETLRLRDLFVERFALRGGVAHVPETVQDEDGNIIDVFEAIQEAYASVQAGGFMALPNARDKEGNYLFDFTEAKLENYDAGPITEVLDSQDAEQLLSFGIPPKTVIEGDAVGSFALVSQQMLILFAVIEDIVDQFVKSFQRYVIDKVVGMNWTLGKPRIQLVYTRLTEKPDNLASELVKLWLGSGQLSPFVLSGAVDVEKVFERVGIPVSPEFTQTLQELRKLLPLPTAAPGAGNLPPGGENGSGDVLGALERGGVPPRGFDFALRPFWVGTN